MGFIKEFKEFAFKGSVVDLAVGVIIGGAFGAIVSSLTDHVITPLILDPALKAANVENLDQLKWGSVQYGSFLASVIKFLIIAFALFLLIKGINSASKKKVEAPPAPPEPSSTDKLLMEIRDELKK